MSMIIAELMSRHDISWYPDANAILSGFTGRTVRDCSRVRLVQQVVDEIRKRPLFPSANAFVSDVIAASGIIGRKRFSEMGLGRSYDFLLECACTPSPLLRIAMDAVGAEDGAEAVNRQLQKAAHEGTFLKTPNTLQHILQQFIAMEIGSREDLDTVNKINRRGWFGYPAKRRKGLDDGSYQFTDEILVATSVADALLANERPIVVSDDYDIVAVFKQITDNVIWTACVVDCMRNFGEFGGVRTQALFAIRCKMIDEFRQREAIKSILNDSESSSANSVEGLMLVPSETILLRPGSPDITARYTFPDVFVRFVTNIDILLRGSAA